MHRMSRFHWITAHYPCWERWDNETFSHVLMFPSPSVTINTGTSPPTPSQIDRITVCGTVLTSNLSSVYEGTSLMGGANLALERRVGTVGSRESCSAHSTLQHIGWLERSRSAREGRPRIRDAEGGAGEGRTWETGKRIWETGKDLSLYVMWLCVK
jgi:hypothetical protein